MLFSFTDAQLDIVDAVTKIAEKFDETYWLKRDTDGEFPHEFHKAFADAGWLGIALPEAYGGAGLGITEAALMMQAIAQSGAGFSGASALHMNIFGLNPVVVFGNDTQKARMLPPLIKGQHKACFAVTEPNVGLDTTKIKTKAERHGDHYIVTGQKIWISTAKVASHVLLLVRTTPLDAVKSPTEGLSLFYTPFDRRYVEVREIDKMGRHAVDSNQVFLDKLPVPVADRIGEEGKGFSYILHGMNPERILMGAEAVGLGRAALARATRYAKERIVFSRPIGQNQGIQHPLAKSWAELEAANLIAFRAAALYDAGKPCGVEANAAKYLGAEAGFTACETAIMTHGGMGYAKEYHVERYLRESLVPRIAPVSRELVPLVHRRTRAWPAEVILSPSQCLRRRPGLGCGGVDQQANDAAGLSSRGARGQHHQLTCPVEAHRFDADDLEKRRCSSAGERQGNVITDGNATDIGRRLDARGGPRQPIAFVTSRDLRDARIGRRLRLRMLGHGPARRCQCFRAEALTNPAIAADTLEQSQSRNTDHAGPREPGHSAEPAVVE